MRSSPVPSSGIGRTIAHALASAGAQVVLVARRVAELERVAHEIAEAGGRAAALACDLADRAQLRRCAAQAPGYFGAPDIVVSAAGTNVRKPILEVSDDDWDATMRVNLDAPFFVAQRLAPAMIERGWGRIINIASLQSVRAFADCAPYGASKGAIAQLTRAQAQAWSRYGVDSNAIAPGFFATALTAAVVSDAPALDADGRAHIRRPQRRASRPVGRGAVPRESGVRLRDRPDDLRRRRIFGGMSDIVFDRVGRLFHRDGRDFPALDDVSFAVRAKEFVSIVGPSGCGKTTCLRMAAGLEFPTSGTVSVGGIPSSAPVPIAPSSSSSSRCSRGRRCARTSTSGCARSCRKRQRRDRVARQIELMGLAGYESAFPHQLSGGMQQRVAIARSYVLDPDVLLMDEPFGALDAQTRAVMQEELIKLSRVNPRTVLFITHSVEEAVYLADRVVVMTRRPGRIREIIDVATVRRRRLGPPRAYRGGDG